MTEERAGRLYRRLLVLAPRRLRDEHASEMTELFLLRWREAGARGRSTRLAAWARAIADVIAESARQRRAEKPGGEEARRRAPRRTVMLGSDIRCAVRSLLRQRLATSLIVAMLAIGIAANVAVFGLVNGLFLRPFPLPHPERLVYVNEKAPRWNLEEVGITFPDLVQWQKQQRLFEGIAFYDSGSFNVSDGSRADRIRGARVTHEFAEVLSVRPALGRFFTPEEDRPGGPPAVVLENGFWRERFGGDAQVLGRTLRLDGVTRTVVGVMPEAGDFPGGVRVLVPLAAEPAEEGGQSYSGQAIGRLKRGVTVEQAEADLLRVQQPIWEARDREKIVSPFVRPLREYSVRGFRASASALSAGVALLLLVACANVASLMLARALARRREMAIRVAVGAGGWRLLGQLLAENLVLAGAGGALGLALGYWTLQALVRAVPDEVPRWAVFGLDVRVAAFALAVTLLTMLLFGWAPALHALRDDLRTAMSTATSGTTASPRGRWTLRALVGGEFALAALLLVCGGLLLHAFDRVRHVDPGFDPRGVLTFGIYLPPATYPEPARRLAFWEELERRLHEIPGVESVGAVTCPPLGCHEGGFFDVEGQPRREKRAEDPVVLYRYATPDYFRAMGIRLEAGRFLDDHDGRPGGPRAVIVNEAFARALLPGVTDPVGQRLRQGSQDPWATVVGLVADVKHYGLERPVRPGLYFALPQSPVQGLTFALKTRGEPGALAGQARAAVQALDPDLGLYQVRTMEEALRQSLASRATYSWMLVVFALLALVLALGGTYGVTAYLATQRAREIGIRLALGARAGDIRRTVLAGSFAVAGSGIAAGVLGSMGAARWLSSLLFGVTPHDLLALGGAAGLLVCTSLAVNWASASRAARVDPMSILRTD
jgi:predicted permease